MSSNPSDGQTGDYGTYSFQQVAQAINGGFNNNNGFVPVDPNPIYTVAEDFGEAGATLQYVGLRLISELEGLLGTDDEPGWTGDAANEFAAIMDAILVWLDDCVGRMGMQYNVLMNSSGVNLRQAQAALNKIAADAQESWISANLGKSKMVAYTSDPAGSGAS
jgi:hypothetical protein